jgi:hypothetical protein
MKWIEALKQWNADKDTWCIPRKGTKEYLEVMAIMKPPAAPQPVKIRRKKVEAPPPEKEGESPPAILSSIRKDILDELRGFNVREYKDYGLALNRKEVDEFITQLSFRESLWGKRMRDAAKYLNELSKWISKISKSEGKIILLKDWEKIWDAKPILKAPPPARSEVYIKPTKEDEEEDDEDMTKEVVMPPRFFSYMGGYWERAFNRGNRFLIEGSAKYTKGGITFATGYFDSWYEDMTKEGMKLKNLVWLGRFNLKKTEYLPVALTFSFKMRFYKDKLKVDFYNFNENIQSVLSKYGLVKLLSEFGDQLERILIAMTSDAPHIKEYKHLLKDLTNMGFEYKA